MRFSLHVTLTLTALLLFSGCTASNAFSRFHFSEEKEYATSSLRTSKIYHDNDVIGVFSTIYLNEVDPKKYNGMEYFYIAVYTQNKDTLFDPNSENENKIILKLNNSLPVKIKKLDQKNEFEGLITLDNSWTSYYIVAFNKSQSDKLSLTLQDEKFGSLPLIYQKNEQ